MIVTSSESRISDLCAQWRTQGLSVGFVPTMGALHQGHLSLVEAAAASADRVVVSIFVNPTQFGQGEDLDMYPRTLENDCESVELLGASAVFTPDADVIYPTDFSTSVSVTGISEGLCGAFRPGHFDGVTTVCAVLFGIVRPDMAVFGMKDAQQLAVIRKMVKDLSMPVEIEAGTIIREPDGLAMSSRNSNLSAKERTQALSLFRSLRRAEQLVAEGITGSHEILRNVREIISEQNLAGIDYIEIVDPEKMTPVKDIRGGGLLALAVWFGTTRLIDNIVLAEKKGQNNAD